MKSGNFCIIRLGNRYDNRKTSSYYLLEIKNGLVHEECVILNERNAKRLPFLGENIYDLFNKINNSLFLINDNLAEMLFLDKSGFYFTRNLDFKNKHLFEKSSIFKIISKISKFKKETVLT